MQHEILDIGYLLQEVAQENRETGIFNFETKAGRVEQPEKEASLKKVCESASR